MLKTLFQAVKRLLLALAGGLGGLVVGEILSLLQLHLKAAFGFGMSSLGLKVLVTLLVCVAAGMIAPRFFRMFFLSPISWLLDSDSSGGGFPSGASDVTWTSFFSNVSYMIGLVLFVAGVAFSLPWLVGVGLLGITAFSIVVYRHN